MRARPLDARADMAAVQASLGLARDAQVARIVAMVDAMPDRGAADALIAPLRQRLAQMRPARSFGFVRLLFTPLDPVIVPAARWRPGDAGVPRPVLAPLGVAVRAALPACAAQIDTATLSMDPDDRGAIGAIGAGLWPQAAAVLGQATVPPAWASASGLSDADFAPLAAALAAVLAEAPAVELLATARRLPQDAAIRAVMARAEKLGAQAAATMTAVLLARLPTPGQVLTLAGNADGNRPAERAVDHTLSRLQATVAAGAAEDGDITEAALDAARVAAMLDGMQHEGSPERRRQLDHIRRRADGLCVARFVRAAAVTMARAAALAGTGGGDAAVTELEAAARGLRRLETAGRRLGSADRYETMLNDIALSVKAPDSGFGLADRVRLVEILAGPDEALALLAAPLA